MNALNRPKKKSLINLRSYVNLNYMKAIILAVGIFLSNIGMVRADSIIVCTFSQFATVVNKNGENSKPKLSSEKQIEITFADLDTESPKMKGNAGETNLVLIRKEKNVLWLAEMPGLGGVNLYTIFQDKNIAIWTKQYELGSFPYGFISMGYCR